MFKSKVNIELSLCIVDETLCRGYFYLMDYVIIKIVSGSINKNLARRYIFMDNKNKKEDNTHYLPIFMSIGLSVGVAIGAATNNMPICMCIGLGIGVGIGAALDGQKKQKDKEE